MSVVNLQTHRRAAIAAKRERYHDWLEEEELRHDLQAVGLEFQARREREQILRQRYREAIAQKAQRKGELT